MLGLVFATAGVGDAVGKIATARAAGRVAARRSRRLLRGHGVFTMIMGNAFAAFPVMTAAIGYPLLVQHFDGNPAVVFAIGMLSGYCGTLCTPMAANFNIVPVALLRAEGATTP